MCLRDLGLVSLFLACFLWITVVSQTTSTSCSLKSNTSCEECLSNVSCLWCITDQRCMDYPVKTILPPRSVCRLSEARWGKCWVNFEALIITMSVFAGVIIITVLICCFCCCKCENIGSKKTDERLERQSELRRVRHEERRAQMKSRHDEIRMKYGLTKDSPYSRFENN